MTISYICPSFKKQRETPPGASGIFIVNTGNLTAVAGFWVGFGLVKHNTEISEFIILKNKNK